MKKNIHKSKHISKIVMSMVIILTTLYCTRAYSNIVRTWKVHASCTNNVSSLTSDANSRLQTKNIDDDYAVCATISSGSVDTGWHFNGDVDDDGKVLSEAEESAFDTAAAASGKNSFRLVQWNVTAEWTGFYTSAYGLAVMNGGNSGTLAHEVGHYAGCSHNSEGKTHRIMYATFVTSKNTVNSTEKGKYESKN